MIPRLIDVALGLDGKFCEIILSPVALGFGVEKLRKFRISLMVWLLVDCLIGGLYTVWFAAECSVGGRVFKSRWEFFSSFCSSILLWQIYSAYFHGDFITSTHRRKNEKKASLTRFGQMFTIFHQALHFAVNFPVKRRPIKQSIDRPYGKQKCWLWPSGISQGPGLLAMKLFFKFINHGLVLYQLIWELFVIRLTDGSRVRCQVMIYGYGLSCIFTCIDVLLGQHTPRGRPIDTHPHKSAPKGLTLLTARARLLQIWRRGRRGPNRRRRLTASTRHGIRRLKVPGSLLPGAHFREITPLIVPLVRGHRAGMERAREHTRRRHLHRNCARSCFPVPAAKQIETGQSAVVVEIERRKVVAATVGGLFGAGAGCGEVGYARSTSGSIEVAMAVAFFGITGDIADTRRVFGDNMRFRFAGWAWSAAPECSGGDCGGESNAEVFGRPERRGAFLDGLFFSGREIHQVSRRKQN